MRTWIRSVRTEAMHQSGNELTLCDVQESVQRPRIEADVAGSAMPTEAELGPANGVPSKRPVITITPHRGWRLLDLHEMWQYRDLLYFLVRRDVSIRYKQTLLGVAWALIQPALMMVVFTLFFSRMAGVPAGGIPYPLFAYAGLLPWTMFSAALTNASNSVVGSERLITKIYFPRIFIPLASVGAAVVDFLVGFILLLILLACFGVTPHWGMLMIPVIVALVAILATGLGVLLAALNVAYRDVRYVVPFLIQVGMFATPSIYMKVKYDSSPLMSVLCLVNPLTTLVDTFRSAVTGGAIAWSHLGLAASISIACLCLGALYFRRVEADFADIV